MLNPQVGTKYLYYGGGWEATRRWKLRMGKMGSGLNGYLGQ